MSFVSEQEQGVNTVVLQLWQHHCVDAKWFLLRLEKHCFPSSLVACLRPNKETFFSRACLFYKRAPPQMAKDRVRGQSAALTSVQHNAVEGLFHGTLTALLYQPVRRDWNDAPSQLKSISFGAAWGLCLFFFFFLPFTSPSSPPLRLDITLRLSRQPSNMTDLMTEER